MRRLPREVLAACIRARLNPVELFCYEWTETEIILHVAGQAGEIRLLLADLPLYLLPAPDAADREEESTP